jgi:RNA polymerase sigma-70 factor (ECF subfamily)
VRDTGESPLEPDLVRRARSGRGPAREALGRVVGRTAYVFALQLTRSPDAALDVAQDSALRFFEHIDRFDADRAIEPWLYQIVRNRVRDLARRESLRRHDSLDAWIAGRPLEIADPDPGPPDEVERLELQRRIWGAISGLSDDHREILILRDHHGLPYREIAEIMSIPVGTVMSRLHAARTRLRDELADEGGRTRKGDEDHE